MSATPDRHFRCPDELWAAAMTRANLEHRSLSSVLQEALRAYAEGRYHAQPPRVRVRPSERRLE
jgi:hypothetical protein